MKNAIKQMLLFASAANVIGWVFMLIANFALPESFSGEVETILLFGWPFIVGSAYIFFDIKLDIDYTYSFVERFLIYLLNCIIWVMATILFVNLAIWLATHGPWYTQESTEVWNQSDGVAYEWMFVFLLFGVTFVMVACFFVRTIRYLSKKKRF